MIQAQLILAGNREERLSQADKIIKKLFGFPAREKGHPDLISLESNLSIGISQIRALQKQLALKPYSAPLKVALILQAEKITLPAQNALLKTLEEPPAKTMILLLAPKKENLLPTIISRCQIIQLTQKPEKEVDQKDFQAQAPEVIDILKASLGKRLKLAERFRARPEATKLTQDLLYFWRELLLAKGGLKKKQLQKELQDLSLQAIRFSIEETEKVRKMIEANANPRLGIEALFLAYPRL